ncbi:MAG: 50S ribosomal protein L29 [Candidatus Omnitrophica bacterium]|nr:50S ribosomal protein L29 [Candidatus Omnitrophota bacterium]
MKSLKPRELRELSKDELSQKYASLNQELYNLRFAASAGNIENPSRFREIKRDVARIMTVMREKEYAGVSSGKEKK